MESLEQFTRPTAGRLLAQTIFDLGRARVAESIDEPLESDVELSPRGHS